LERDTRQDIVAELTAQGMSTRAIAPIVGAGVMTVQDDIARVRNRTPETFQPAPDFIRTRVPHPLADEPDSIDRGVEEAFAAVNTDTGEIIEQPTPRSHSDHDLALMTDYASASATAQKFGTTLVRSRQRWTNCRQRFV